MFFNDAIFSNIRKAPIGKGRDKILIQQKL